MKSPGTRFCRPAGAAAAALAVGFLLPAAAAALEPELDLHGQYRPRLEVDNRTLGPSAEDWRIGHRARLEAGLVLGDWRLQLDPQHLLTWGTEGSTLALGSGTLDFHQAYAEGQLAEGLRLRVGRQEIVFDDQRLIGAVDWTQQGRSFDGGRLTWRPADGGPDLDLFGALLTEGPVANEQLYGVRLGAAPGGFDLGAAVIGEYARVRGNGDQDFWRLTPGIQARYAARGLSLMLGGYGQFGAIDGAPGAAVLASYPGHAPAADIVAWMAAARLGYDGGEAGRFTAGADVLSGDGNAGDGTVGVFDTLYATNHKFYGHMDYFLALPAHTGNLGLTDVLATYATEAIPGVVTTLTGHAFLATAESAAGNRLFGWEGDVSLAAPLADGVELVGGYSLFAAGEAMVDIGRAAATGEIGHWGWLQLDVSF